MIATTHRSSISSTSIPAGAHSCQRLLSCQVSIAHQKTLCCLEHKATEATEATEGTEATEATEDGSP